MAWIILIISGAFEAVWALALAASKSFTRGRPTALFLGALAVSMGGLAIALREIDTGTGYAVWVGIGASITVIWSLCSKQEAATPSRIALLTLLIGCVIGLKVVS